MSQRTGATLVEVLVAIFVMALGLLGLLALFPLGALSMAQAIKDSRTAQAAANAFAVAAARDIRHDVLVVGLPPQDRFVDGDPGDDDDDPLPRRPRASPDGPSYPILVDPIGFLSGSSKHVRVPRGLHPKTGIPRVNVSFVNSSSATAVRWFTSLDDISFQKDGQGTGLASSPLRREGRYSWAYLLRRPRSSDTSVVDLTVIVFSGRPTALGLGENAYAVDFSTDTNIVRVPYKNQDKPAVRSGGWILDATMVEGVKGKLQPDPHGFFYRVVNVTEGADPAGPYVDLELQTNPKVASKSSGVLVVLDGVAEVFEKGPGWRP